MNVCVFVVELGRYVERDKGERDRFSERLCGVVC